MAVDRRMLARSGVGAERGIDPLEVGRHVGLEASRLSTVSAIYLTVNGLVPEETRAEAFTAVEGAGIDVSSREPVRDVGQESLFGPVDVAFTKHGRGDDADDQHGQHRQDEQADTCRWVRGERSVIGPLL